MPYKHFRNAYIEAIIFTGARTDDPDATDNRYDISDDMLSQQAAKIIDRETETFYNLFSHMWEGHMTDEQAGHDFWLTRNRHGTGFWDRGNGKLGEYLTKGAHNFPEQSLYLDDTGTLHLEF